MKRSTAIFLTSVLATAGAVAAAGPAAAATTGATGADPTPDGLSFVHVHEVFRPADSGADALSHDPDLVPVGATVTVTAVSTAFGTVTLLAVRGVVPQHEYGVHVHVGTCGEDPLQSGAHYQHVPDPDPPSTDPAFANPENEIWLDFRADRRGNGVAASFVRWQFGARPAGAVVLHEHFTRTGPGEAGVAGARVGCVNAPFAR